MLGRGSALAVVALLAGAGAAVGQSDPAAVLLPPVAAPSSARRPAAGELPMPPVRSADARDDRPRIKPEPADLPPAARLTAPKDVVPVSAAAVDDARKAVRPAARPPSGEELFDYLTARRKGPKSEAEDDGDGLFRSAGRFGGIRDAINETVGPDARRGWFVSDHAFDCFVSPITNPFLFEDPRALTEIRPIFIYQKIPSPQPNFSGGSIWFFGTQARIAFGQRFSLVVNKLGAIDVVPGSGTPYKSEFGFAELWLGPKYTFIRNEETGTLAAAGVQFQLPIGSGNVYQNTGDLSIVPYASVGQNFLKTRLGSFNAIGNGGYSFSVNKQRSDYFWLSGHLDYDVLNRHRFYPVAELNWFQYTTDGTSQFIKGEGRDLVNFGSVAKGSSLLTGALGGRVKLTRSTEFGAAFEVPLAGNKDFFRYRFTLDFIWRY